MGFEAFKAAISGPALRQVAEHWAAVRGTRSVPRWRDIRPSEIRPHLSILWSWKYDASADRFTGRLAGDAIEAIFGGSFRGAYMRDLFPAGDYEHIVARHRRVVSEPVLFHGHGLVFRHLDRYGVGERIILPLSDSGDACDGILGATLYETTAGSLPPDAANLQEVENWFPLG